MHIGIKIADRHTLTMMTAIKDIIIIIIPEQSTNIIIAIYRVVTCIAVIII